LHPIGRMAAWRPRIRPPIASIPGPSVVGRPAADRAGRYLQSQAILAQAAGSVRLEFRLASSLCLCQPPTDNVLGRLGVRWLPYTSTTFGRGLAPSVLVRYIILGSACGVSNVCCDVSAPMRAAFELSAGPPPKPAIACTSGPRRPLIMAYCPPSARLCSLIPGFGVPASGGRHCECKSLPAPSMVLARAGTSSARANGAKSPSRGWSACDRHSACGSVDGLVSGIKSHIIEIASKLTDAILRNVAAQSKFAATNPKSAVLSAAPSPDAVPMMP